MAHHDNPAHFGVRTKQYKLIFFYGQNYRKGGPKPTRPGWELYDMKNDPGQESNVIDQQPKIADSRLPSGSKFLIMAALNTALL